MCITLPVQGRILWISRSDYDFATETHTRLARSWELATQISSQDKNSLLTHWLVL